MQSRCRGAGAEVQVQVQGCRGQRCSTEVQVQWCRGAAVQVACTEVQVWRSSRFQVVQVQRFRCRRAGAETDNLMNDRIA